MTICDNVLCQRVPALICVNLLCKNVPIWVNLCQCDVQTCVNLRWATKNSSVYILPHFLPSNSVSTCVNLCQFQSSFVPRVPICDIWYQFVPIRYANLLCKSAMPNCYANVYRPVPICDNCVNLLRQSVPTHCHSGLWRMLKSHANGKID